MVRKKLEHAVHVLISLHRKYIFHTVKNTNVMSDCALYITVPFS